MRDWKFLANEVRSFKEKPCIWPLLLDSDTQQKESEVMLKKLNTLNQLILNRLLALLDQELPDDEKEKRVRAFLTARGSFFFSVNNTIDYTLNFNLPANQACLKVTAFIRKYDEAVCQIVMPSIEKIIGTAFLPEEVKFASENSDGQFMPQYFLTHTNGKALIALTDLFQLARQDTNRLFSSRDAYDFCLMSSPADPIAKGKIYVGEKEGMLIYSLVTLKGEIIENSQTNIAAPENMSDEDLVYLKNMIFEATLKAGHTQPDFFFDLTPDDFERISSCAGDASRHFFDALKRSHQLRYNKKLSIGSALEDLCIALFKSSKEKNGSETIGDIKECRKPILDFYDIWSALPDQSPDDIKNRIKKYAVDGASYSLESYLLCLFVNLGDIPFTDDEHTRVIIQDNILPCTFQISGQLAALINRHPDLFDLGLSGQYDCFDDQEILSAEKMDQLQKNFEQALENRLPLKGMNDRQCFFSQQLFEILSYNNFDDYFIEDDISVASTIVTNIHEFISALMITPKDKWHALFYACVHRLIDIFGNERALFYTLSQLPMRDWPLFFNTFSGEGLGGLLCGADLGVMLYDLPEPWIPLFISAMDASMMKEIFSNGKEVAHFFGSTPIGHWSKNYILFQAHIDSVLSELEEFCDVFYTIPSDDWLELAQLFRSIILEHLKNPLFFQNALFQLAPHERILFLKVMTSCFDHPLMTLSSFVEILKVLPLSVWSEAFSLLGAAQIARLIPTYARLVTFLTQIKSIDRVICLQEIAVYLPNFSIASLEFYSLLKTFPDCDSGLLHLFKDQLPRILSGYFDIFAVYEETHQPPSDYYQIAFKWVAEKALPLLLTRQNLSRMCPSFAAYGQRFFNSPDSVWILCQNLCRVEMHSAARVLTVLQANSKKIEILDAFIYESKTGMIPKTPFYEELIHLFGENFFFNMMQYHKLPVPTPTPYVSAFHL